MYSLKVKSTFQFNKQLMTTPKFAHLRNLDFHWSELLIKLDILPISPLHPPQTLSLSFVFPFLLPQLFFTGLFYPFLSSPGVVIETDLYSSWVAGVEMPPLPPPFRKALGWNKLAWAIVELLGRVCVFVCARGSRRRRRRRPWVI